MAVTILYNHTNTTTSSLAFIVVPNLWAPGISFMEDNFFIDWSRKEEWFGDNLSILHVLWTLFLLLLHQFHLSLSGTRSQRLGTPALPYSMVYNPVTGVATRKRKGLY